MQPDKKNTGEEQDYHWARQFEFGDSHASTHHFVEQAVSRGPKEIGCALAASFLVAPLVSIIDKCIIQEIAGTKQFVKAASLAAADMFFTPKAFFGGKSFLLTFGVYFGTYATANLSELVSDVNQITNDDRRKTMKVSAASAANISLLAWRDSIFAREFGSSVPKPTPLRTIGLFGVRDSATMGATFFLAPAAANYLHGQHGWDRNVAELSTALGIPMVTQFITAPLHIHAMDYYNNPASTTNVTRMSVIQKEFKTVAFARGLRILPLFGIGSYSNNKFREFFIQQEDESLLLQRRLTGFFDHRRFSRTTPGGGIIQKKITEKGLFGSAPPVVEDGGARRNKKGLV